MPPSPIKIPHCLNRDGLTVRAIIETPAGSRAKLAFDPDSGLFSLGKLLPLGFAMPLDFGFIPSTCAGDGDPLDIMVLSEAELPPGCMVTARLLGAIEVEQSERGPDGRLERNDRLIARLSESRSWSHVDRLEQLGDPFVAELNRFFKVYKEARGQNYHVLAVSGPSRAADLVTEWSADG
ncbi:MAG: inorganic diphosphatase [Verrucomicrobiota bacterium]|nr:inorganic diphosphatase [Verrucomicrobiota bacterium]